MNKIRLSLERLATAHRAPLAVLKIEQIASEGREPIGKRVYDTRFEVAGTGQAELLVRCSGGLNTAPGRYQTHVPEPELRNFIARLQTADLERPHQTTPAWPDIALSRLRITLEDTAYELVWRGSKDPGPVTALDLALADISRWQQAALQNPIWSLHVAIGLHVHDHRLLGRLKFSNPGREATQILHPASPEIAASSLLLRFAERKTPQPGFGLEPLEFYTAILALPQLPANQWITINAGASWTLEFDQPLPHHFPSAWKAWVLYQSYPTTPTSPTSALGSALSLGVEGP